jgi:hypothetical protein
MNQPSFVARIAKLALVVLALAALVMPASAQRKPINIALVTPIQIVPEDVGVSGFRWNIIYGKNSSMSGLDIGIANHVAGHMEGVQLGWVNMTESMVGWQDGIVNYTVGEFEGFQWGGVNYAGRINGLQLGIVNYAERANGVQVGLVNIIKEGGMFPVMIIANWGFEQARN